MLNRNSSRNEKKEAQDVLFDALSTAFFDRVTFITAPGNTNSGADTTSITTFNVTARVPDTSLGRHLASDKTTRFRTNIYVGGAASDAAKAEFYLLILATWNSTTAPSTSDIANSLLSFVGIHANAGVVKLVSKGDGQFRKSSQIATFVKDTTYTIEFLYNGKDTSVFINNTYVGSISRTHTRTESEIVLYPIIAPIRSVGGTGVTINMENYQLIQDK